MQPRTTKSVCAQIDKQHRDDLAFILAHNKRTIKGQLEIWIEQERRYIETHG